MVEAIGIDIGGTNIKAVVVDAEGVVQVQQRRPTPGDRAALIIAVRDLLAALPEARAVGVSSPGLARSDNRAIAWMRGRLGCVEGLDWSDALGRPVPVLNDGHAAALGEAWVGAAKGLRDVVMLTLGTGVGGGVIIGGRPYQGATGRAGHLGHITLDLAGGPDIVGTPGSLEDLVGDHTVAARTAGRFADTAALVAAAGGGDADAQAAWRATIHALACGVVSIVNAFDPQCVILGGGIAAAGAALFDPLRAAMDPMEWRPLGEPVPVMAARLGDLAGALGAARFAMTRAALGTEAAA